MRIIFFDKYLMKSNQNKAKNLSFYVSCAISILSVIDVVLRKLVYQYRDGFYSILRYFLQVIVVGSTRSYVCRIGTLWFCYIYVEKNLT